MVDNIKAQDVSIDLPVKYPSEDPSVVIQRKQITGQQEDITKQIQEMAKEQERYLKKLGEEGSAAYGTLLGRGVTGGGRLKLAGELKETAEEEKDIYGKQYEIYQKQLGHLSDASDYAGLTAPLDSLLNEYNAYTKNYYADKKEAASRWDIPGFGKGESQAKVENDAQHMEALKKQITDIINQAAEYGDNPYVQQHAQQIAKVLPSIEKQHGETLSYAPQETSLLGLLGGGALSMLTGNLLPFVGAAAGGGTLESLIPSLLGAVPQLGGLAQNLTQPISSYFGQSPTMGAIGQQISQIPGMPEVGDIASKLGGYAGQTLQDISKYYREGTGSPVESAIETIYGGQSPLEQMASRIYKGYGLESQTAQTQQQAAQKAAAEQAKIMEPEVLPYDKAMQHYILTVTPGEGKIPINIQGIGLRWGKPRTSEAKSKQQERISTLMELSTKDVDSEIRSRVNMGEPKSSVAKYVQSLDLSTNALETALNKLDAYHATKKSRARSSAGVTGVPKKSQTAVDQLNQWLEGTK